MNDEHITIETIDIPNPDKLRRFRVHLFERHLINVTLTSNPSIVRRWIRATLWYKGKQNNPRGGLLVGLGIQRRPYLNSAATLQLCVGHHCLVFHMQHAPIVPLALRRFLSYHKNTFIGVFDHKEPRSLLDSEHHLSVSNLVDVRDEVKLLGWSGDLSVEQLADRLLGFKDVNIPQEIGISTNWDDVSLTEEQVQYASVYAFLSFSMGMALSARRRRHWAKGYQRP
ncbi:uncharacterized protein LOC121242258 [Juglans microcarpa x Juglans regia]|uniref:uncharacterized protein LOC121242258 n=1 Tax=Juglans microcarpa x Juglans regia TaxID=2249226 RepID=UPI001B7EDCA3|nr:uncharacterized protein LOC121242258 [Juglans microcarpa x Juglans regia]